MSKKKIEGKKATKNETKIGDTSVGEKKNQARWDGFKLQHFEKKTKA